MIMRKICFLFISLLVFICLNNFYFSLAQESTSEEEALFVAKKAFLDGFYDVSLELLENFIKKYPYSSKIYEAHLLIGQCYFQQNKFYQALTKFDSLLNQPEAKNIKDALLYWIGEVYFKINAFSKASHYYQELIKEFKDSSYLANAYYSLGWCFYAEKRYREAKDVFLKLEENFPDSPQAKDASLKILECLYTLKEYKDLKDKASFYLKKYPKESDNLDYLYFYSAEADYYLGNFLSALDAYNKLIDKPSVNKELKDLAYIGLIWCYLKLKNYSEAERILKELKPDSLDKNSQGLFVLAWAYLYAQTNRFKEAEETYDKLINLSNQDNIVFQAYLGKADALYNQARFKEAIQVYNILKEKFAGKDLPSSLWEELHYGLAWSYLKEGEFKLAIEEFRQVLGTTNDKTVKVSALCHIADTYQDVANYEEALKVYEQILKDYPDTLYSDYVQYQLALVWIKMQNFDSAILALNTLKRNFPQSKLMDEINYTLGLVYFQKEDYQSAKDVLEVFLREFKESNIRAKALYLLGSSLYNLEDFERASVVFKELVQNYPKQKDLVIKAEYEIADCLYRLGKEKEAVERFKFLRSKYPDSELTPEVIWWLGQYYYQKNELDIARRYFNSLVYDFPQNNLVASGFYALALTYEQEAKYAQAKENFKKVIELDKTDLAGMAYVGLGDIAFKEENYSEALNYYLSAESYKNLLGIIYPKIAEIFLKENNLAKALEFYEKSLEVVSQRELPQIQFKIAFLLENMGKTKEAIAEYLKLNYFYPEDKQIRTKSLLRVAQIYEAEGNPKEAIKFYEKILSLDVPEAKYAKEKIEELKKR